MEKSIGKKLKWQVILFLARRLPPCKALLPLFSEARERVLTRREKVLMRLHLFTCEACRRYVAQIERMSETVKFDDGETEISVKLSNEARTRIKTALEAAAHRKH